MKNKKRWRPGLVLAAMFASGSAWATDPVLHPGNVSNCDDLNIPGLVGGSSESPPDDPETFALPGGNSITFDYVPDGQSRTIDFSATIGMSHIIIKGGPNANVYTYDPAATSDSGLHAPINPENNQPYDISHVAWCLKPVPTAAKTAEASWKRFTTWQLTKSVTPETITMFDGDSHDVEYTVTATPSVLGEYRIAGNITVKDPFDAGWVALSANDTIQVDNGGPQLSKVWDAGGNADTMTCTQPAPNPDKVILSCSYEFLIDSDDYPALLDATGGGNGVSVIANNGGADLLVIANASFSFGTPESYGDSLAVDDSVLPADPDHTFTAGGTWVYPRTFACDADEGTKGNTAIGTYSTGPSTEGTVQDTASVTVNCETVTVTKDATTSYGRVYTWEPDKWVVVSPADAKVIGSEDCQATAIADGPYAGSFLCNDASIRLNPGDLYDTVYKLEADQSFTDGDFAVSGNITAGWPAGLTPDFPGAPVDTLTFTDAANGTQAPPVTCAVQGATSLECTYSDSLPRPFVPGYNEASIERQRKCYDKNGVATDCNGTVTYTSNQAELDYGAPATETGKCVVISDLFNGIAGLNGGPSFGWVVDGNRCEDFSQYVTGDVNPDPLVENSLDILAAWILPTQVGPDKACEFMVPNVLSLGAGNEDEAMVKVNVTRLCAPPTCTYTQGYWKTHVNYAPKPQFSKKRDATWDLIDGAGTENEDATFYLSGKSYIEVMWTPPKGNAYYNLAHQYIAALLNKLDGADSTLIDADLAVAHTLFSAKAPGNAYWKKYQTSVMQLADKFAQFNEGTLPGGPRHCSVSPATDNAAK